MDKTDILSILRANNTVFTFKEILLASEETNASLFLSKGSPCSLCGVRYTTA